MMRGEGEKPGPLIIGIKSPEGKRLAASADKAGDLGEQEEDFL